MIKYIPRKEYEALHARLKGSLQVSSDKLELYPGMTREERSEAIHRAFNPPLPLEIRMVTLEGSVCYRIAKDVK